MFCTGLALSGRGLRQAVLLWGLATVAAGGVGTAQARTADSASTAVSLASLPAQAQTLYAQILSGGPFSSDKDGIVFGNRERLLPRKSRGYYREYTVRTPGSRDRGARRIVCGGEPPTPPEVCYYTADHYASFRRIAP